MNRKGCTRYLYPTYFIVTGQVLVFSKHELPDIMIETIETFVCGPVGIVRIRTRDGCTGTGQCGMFDPDISVQLIHRRIAPLLKGVEIDDPAALIETCLEKLYKFRGTYLFRAFCGIDTALWDIKGKRAGLPVYALFTGGKAAAPLRVYASSMQRNNSVAEELQRVAFATGEYGIDAVKIKIGARCGAPEEPVPGRTRELVPALAKAFGDRLRLMADANGSYDRTAGVETGKFLQDHGYVHYEEPCPFWKIEDTAFVAKALSIPVAGGEQDNVFEQWQRIIDLKGIRILQPDIGYAGGFSRALTIAEMGCTRGLVCMPHSSGTSLLGIISMHFVASIGNSADRLERRIDDLDGKEGIGGLAMKVKDGCMALPSEPGWGVEINEEWLHKSDYLVSGR
jgi:L-alanine-DL-glutamate epimerase-like enolase superfamily enzyme